MCQLKLTMNRHKNLSDNITFEEFEKLADREPNLKGDWIYRLTRSFYNGDIKPQYPMFELDDTEDRLFMSFDAAVKFLRGNINDDLYGSWITQIPVGGRQFDHGAEWLFGKDGNMIDYTTTHSFGEGIEASFFGRSGTRCRFKEGDIVEVVGQNKVKLAVLCSEVPDVEHCWRIYNRCKDDDRKSYFLDYSDDSAVILEGPSYCYHNHVSPLALIKPRFEIPENIRAEMNTWLDRAENETEEAASSHGSCRLMRHKLLDCEDYVARYEGLSFYIIFGEHDVSPLLLISDDYGLNVSLRIDCPAYADYEDFKGRLTDSQLRSIQDFLEDIEICKTKWWYIIRDWNEDEEHRVIPLDTPLPDYTTLIKCK